MSRSGFSAPLSFFFPHLFSRKDVQLKLKKFALAMGLSLAVSAAPAFASAGFSFRNRYCGIRFAEREDGFLADLRKDPVRETPELRLLSAPYGVCAGSVSEGRHSERLYERNRADFPPELGRRVHARRHRGSQETEF